MFKNSQNLSVLLTNEYQNDDFEGFCVDLLKELAQAINFQYKIKPITTLRYDDMIEEVKSKVRKINKFFCC